MVIESWGRKKVFSWCPRKENYWLKQRAVDSSLLQLSNALEYLLQRVFANNVINYVEKNALWCSFKSAAREGYLQMTLY